MVVVVMNPGKSFVNVMCDMEDGVITNTNTNYEGELCGTGQDGAGWVRWDWEFEKRAVLTRVGVAEKQGSAGVGYQRCEV